jgi:hypothetical protein
MRSNNPEVELMLNSAAFMLHPRRHEPELKAQRVRIAIAWAGIALMLTASILLFPLSLDLGPMPGMPIETWRLGAVYTAAAGTFAMFCILLKKGTANYSSFLQQYRELAPKVFGLALTELFQLPKREIFETTNSYLLFQAKKYHESVRRCKEMSAQEFDLLCPALFTPAVVDVLDKRGKEAAENGHRRLFNAEVEMLRSFGILSENSSPEDFIRLAGKHMSIKL